MAVEAKELYLAAPDLALVQGRLDADRAENGRFAAIEAMNGVTESERWRRLLAGLHG